MDLGLSELVALITPLLTVGCMVVDTWIRWRERKPRAPKRPRRRTKADPG